MRVNVIEWRRPAAALVFLCALIPVSGSAHLIESRSNAPPTDAPPQHPTSLAETSAALAAFGYKSAAEPDEPIYIERAPERARNPNGLENRARKLWRYGDSDAALALLSEENLEREASVGDGDPDDLARGWMLRARILSSRKQFVDSGRAYAMATRVSPDWSAVWVEYGNFQHKQNHRQEARRGYLRALKLARAEGDDGEVAVILNNLGVAYNSEGRRQLARKAHEEALAIRRKLATDEPDQFLPDLAISLMNLGLLDRADRRLDEAILAFEEALSVRHALEDDHPGAFLADVAVTLTHLGNLYRQVRRPEDAREAFDEALSIRRMLAELDPDEWLPLVADSLADLGYLALDDKRRKDAISAFEEARSILRRFVRASPAVYEPQLKHVESTLVDLGD